MYPIRIAKSDDAKGVLEIYAPFIRDTTTTFEYDVPSEEEMAYRINKYMEKGPWLVAMDGNQIAGYAYACEHRARSAYQWSIELSVYLHPDYQRQGLATRLYHCALEILHQQGYCSVYAGITQPNDPSNAFHLSMGFQLIGTYSNVGFKHDKWCDVKWYELSLNKSNLPPRPIIDLQTLKDSGRLAEILEYHNSRAAIDNQ